MQKEEEEKKKKEERELLKQTDQEYWESQEKLKRNQFLINNRLKKEVEKQIEDKK